MPSRLPSSPPEARPNNQILAALPANEFERLRTHLTHLPAKARQVFQKQAEPLTHVIFPNGGVLSVTHIMKDGTTVETAVVGREGMAGIEAFLGDGLPASGQIVMQVPDTSVEILDVVAFRGELARQGALYYRVGRYMQVALQLTMQSAACNARHHVTERCPRWLLMTHDRVGRDEFQLSQEFLGMMLGVRRQSVSLVANTLQKAGLIKYKHGRITIVDRAGLEAASCECYGALRIHFDSLQTAR